MVKIKSMTEEEFCPIKKKNWMPVKLTHETLPSWMKEIPETQRLHNFASGSSVPVSSMEFGFVVGGIDVYRDAKTHPEKVNFNVRSLSDNSG